MYKGYGEVIDSRAAADNTRRDFERELTRDYGLYGIDTGHHDLNIAINGFTGGKVYTFGGRSGTGKSAFLLPMIAAGSNKSADIQGEYLMCSWELNERNISNRLISYYTGIPNVLLTQGAKLLTDAQKNKVREAIDKIAEIPIVYQLMSLDESQIAGIINEWYEDVMEKHKNSSKKVYPIVFIDYIGLAVFEGAGLRTYAIGSFMLKLKQLANKLNISIVVLAQLNRAVDKENRPPTAADFQDSASLEQTSDCLIALHRPEMLDTLCSTEDPASGEMIPNKGKTLMRIIKNRMGFGGDFLLNSDLRYYRYWSLNHEFGFDYNAQYKEPRFWARLYGLQLPDNFEKKTQEKPPELPF